MSTATQHEDPHLTIADGARRGLGPATLAALATALLLVDDARLNGLIDIDLDVDRERCELLLHELHAIAPPAPAGLVEQKALDIMVELGALRT